MKDIIERKNVETEVSESKMEMQMLKYKKEAEELKKEVEKGKKGGNV
jgi:hypothetical protein